MKIVVLDGYALNPGDLSWEGLKQLGDLEIHNRTEIAQILSRAKYADLVLTNKTLLSSESLRQLPKLKYIGVLATGYNCVDVQTAKELGIAVTNIPSYGTASVAQFVFALLLELCHNVKQHHYAVANGQWATSRDWTFWLTPLIELEGKVMGIVGLGRIGRHVARIAIAFGMHVIATDQVPIAEPGVQPTTLEKLLVESDVVSLHCPLFPETLGLINRERLATMKSSAFLINTSRGPLIIDEDLADALNQGVIAGAGLDVLSMEPPMRDNALLKSRNCIVTPHIAWATKEARSRLMNIAVKNVEGFLLKQPVNVVNS
ncbi:MAG: D-2-hydroxyacid dehydrogenase [Candidatus Nitrotoga sp.]|nr:D-2-hydroxyacid dehydrogenase [Candidatus Nitrotoga sp.]